MALHAIDECVRNLVCVGADVERIAILDNFCWGDPLRPETMGTLLEASRGCYDAALRYGTPFISGKDSLNNEYMGTDGLRHAIPPTLLISAIGLIDDVNQSVTMDLKEPGSVLYLVGDFAPAFGGSHFNLVTVASSFVLRPPSSVGEAVPSISKNAPAVYRAIHAAIEQGLVRSCHDLSEGGLGVAAAEMCIGGRLGLAIDLALEDPVRALFGETNGCLLVEVKSEHIARFERLLDTLPRMRIATVLGEPTFTVNHEGKRLCAITLDELVSAWTNPERAGG
jgi:phosphoribosylformylglycinamidine synthase